LLSELDRPRSEERGRVVSHVVSIFNKLWESSWGARLEHILRTALGAYRTTGTNFLALPKPLKNEAYRAELL